ncbi:MAG: hypothetical protein NW224_01405 [Leptolyngbyaceae cyanobacterium bins.302]|nr:hypothetical protein [Leptolyngbyaceae cyanobacterium bins.302]
MNDSTFLIELVFDTGIADYLCLLPEAINLLKLPFLYRLSANLVSNSLVVLPIH